MTSLAEFVGRVCRWNKRSLHSTFFWTHDLPNPVNAGYGLVGDKRDCPQFLVLETQVQCGIFFLRVLLSNGNIVWITLRDFEEVVEA